MNENKAQSSKLARIDQLLKTRQQQGRGKRDQNPNVLHEDRKIQEHEHPELRLTR